MLFCRATQRALAPALFILVGLGLARLPAGAQATYLGQFGSAGGGNGQFSKPYDVKIGSGGIMYVADAANNRVEEFNSTGTYLGQFGSQGSGNGQFSGAGGVAVSSGGTVYVVDNGNKRVEYFDATGTYLGQFGSGGNGNGLFSFPQYVAVGSSGNIFVTDAGNGRVQYFSPTGTYLGQFGSLGSGNGQFNSPEGMAISGSTVYVADSNNNRVEEFNVPAAAPEPSACAVWGIGALGLCGMGWRARRRTA